MTVSKEQEEIVPEKVEINRREVDSKKSESGYSETEQAKDIEMRSGDLSSQKRSRGMQGSDRAKALEEYHAVSRELGNLVESYISLLEKDLHQAQKMLSDIETLRKTQQSILDKLFK